MEAPQGSQPADAAVQWEAPQPRSGPAPGLEFASHGGRFIASLVDQAIIGALVLGSLPLLALAGVGVWNLGWDRPPGEIAVLVALFAAWLVIIFGYFPWFWARGGRTPGMRLFGLLLVRDRDGGPVDPGKAVLRMIGLFFVSPAVLYLGLLWIFIDPRRRAWHDLIAGTVMVQRRRP